MSRGTQGDLKQRGALRLVSPTQLAEDTILGRGCLRSVVSRQRKAITEERSVGREGPHRLQDQKGPQRTSRRRKKNHSVRPHEAMTRDRWGEGVQTQWPPPLLQVLRIQEFRNLREVKQLWMQSGPGRPQDSRSQKEACSWPLEPQERDQAAGEGGSKGIDEFL